MDIYSEINFEQTFQTISSRKLKKCLSGEWLKLQHAGQPNLILALLVVDQRRFLIGKAKQK